MDNRFASFYRCLAFARFWKVKFWRSFIKCQFFNDDWTDFHKNIYLYIFILSFFSKTGKTWVLHRVKMMARWPGREWWPKWPIDPVTQWPSSMSVADCLSTNKAAVEMTIETEASLAVDGFASTHSCTQADEAFPWWAVDLGEPYSVDSVDVTYPSVNADNRNYRRSCFVL